VAVNAAGEVYAVGGFGGTINLGGGPVTSSGPQTAFFAKFSPAGALAWLNSYGNASSLFGLGLALDASGTPTISGDYEGTIDFGGGPLPTETGQDGAFIARVAP
jgi:hypothetical protein